MNRIKEIKLQNFRNFSTLQTEFHPQLNLITGPNGAGKSSLVDAIHCCSFGRSYFASSDSYLLNKEKDFFRIESFYTIQEDEFQIVVKYQRGKRKELELNAKKYKKLSDHIGLSPVVCIAPGDVSLIEQGSEVRRKYLDQTLAQTDVDYVKHLTVYNRLIKQRNAWLKSQEKNTSADPAYLEVIDRQLEEHANYIHMQRLQLLDVLNPVFSERYNQISQVSEPVSISYKSHHLDASFLSYMQEVRFRDLAIGYSSRGIHKDDLLFHIHDMPLKSIGSQGQIKSFLFSLKLAQFQLIHDQTQKAPIMILDDIFDKLDDDRVTHILNLIANEWKGQVFITDTSANRLKEICTELKVGFSQLYIKEGSIIDDI